MLGDKHICDYSRKMMNCYDCHVIFYYSLSYSGDASMIVLMSNVSQPLCNMKDSCVVYMAHIQYKEFFQ